MLMKPKRWLGYTIELNDLLPAYELIVDRFAGSGVPLDATFGSNTEGGVAFPGVLIAVGAAVEPARLIEVLALLEDIGDKFLVVHNDASHNRVIYIGALNLDKEPVVAISEGIVAALHRDGASARDMREAIAAAPRVYPMKPREPCDEM